MASSCTSAAGRYLVFLSFCGEDPRQGLISYLYDALCAEGVKTFIDEKISKGDPIDKIFEAIKEAKIHIVVYSKSYASSKWCLRELAEIMKSLKVMNNGHVLPVFYKVNPSEIRCENGITHGHLQNHEAELGKNNSATVAIWKAALIDLAGIAGWHFENGAESKLVKDVVTRVLSLLKNQPFTPSEINKITDNFKTLIRASDFGKVFRGTIIRSGTTVAVKELYLSQPLAHKFFLAEAQKVMSVQHRNLVRLVGYCGDANTKKAYLVYEISAKGNLRRHLSNQMKPSILAWEERLKIARDVARGLCSLHNGCEQVIIHGDLRTSNIFLSGNMEAKIGNFGFSQTFEAENEDGGRPNFPTKRVGGNVDPELGIHGQMNKKTDVYSFGIVLFELITGRYPETRTRNGSIGILKWVNPMIERRDIQSIVDPSLNGKFSIDSAWKVIEIAMSCVMSSARRPDSSRVLAALDELIDLTNY